MIVDFEKRTAWSALHDKARVRSGETIVITAASGGFFTSYLFFFNFYYKELEDMEFNLQRLQDLQLLQLAVEKMLIL
jgi:hypothetical protein